jgi:hypothetical protein
LCFQYDCGASLPTAQRYTDFRYRRVAPRIRLDLDQAGAVELVAILRVLPVRFARYAFHWKGAARERAESFLRNADLVRLSEPYYRDNLARLSPETVGALINAMRDGGWKPSSGLPPVLRDALRALLARGMTQAQAGAVFGLDRQCVSNALRRRKPAFARVGLVL